MNPAAVPTVNPHYELHLTSQTCTLFEARRATGLPREHMGMESFRQWSIDQLTAQYLLACDGIRSHDTITQTLGVPFRLVLDRIGDYLANQAGAVTYLDTADPAPQAALFVTGSFDSYAPLHMSVEITDGCNMTCDHCYASANPFNQDRRSTAETLALFRQMRRGGVRVLEITGGECTTHPGFKEIVAAACEQFHLVAVLTNGFLLGRRAELASWLSQFDNLTVQVSIDNIGTKHDEFRHKQGAFDAACEAVRRLKAAEVFVRVAMTVTSDNVDEVEAVFLLSRELGANAFAAAVATNFGRGSQLGICGSVDHHLQHAVSQQLEPYSDDPLLAANRLMAERMVQDKEINCGAGWRSFALNGATGQVRACLFLSESAGLGSVDGPGYDAVFRSHQIEEFRNAPAPSPHLETCRDCKFLPSCQGCLAKAMLVAETENSDCAWAAAYFGGAPNGQNNSSQLKGFAASR